VVPAYNTKSYPPGEGKTPALPVVTTFQATGHRPQATAEDIPPVHPCPECAHEARDHELLEGSGLVNEATVTCVAPADTPTFLCPCRFRAEDHPEFAIWVKEEEMPKWTEQEIMDRLSQDENKPLEGLQPSSVYATIRAILPIINQQSSPSSTLPTTGKEGGTPRPGVPPCSSGFDHKNLDTILDGSHKSALQSREEMTREITEEVLRSMGQKVVSQVLDAIRKDPALIRLSQEKPAIEVKIERRTIPMDGSSYKGRIATLIHEGFFNGKGRVFSEVFKEMCRRGMSSKTPNVRISEALSELTGLGFFYRGDNKEYIVAPGAESRVVSDQKIA
jgi:hypothetical protein